MWGKADNYRLFHQVSGPGQCQQCFRLWNVSILVGRTILRNVCLHRRCMKERRPGVVWQRVKLHAIVLDSWLRDRADTQ